MFDNIVTSVRWMTGTLAFLIFLIVGLLKDADFTVLIIGGLVTYVLFSVLGFVAAGMLGRINKEIQLEPIEEKPDHEREIGRHIDLQQIAEIPMPE